MNMLPDYEMHSERDVQTIELDVIAEMLDTLFSSLSSEAIGMLAQVRHAILNIMAENNPEETNPLQGAWQQYDMVCEQIENDFEPTAVQARAMFHIGTMVYKAAIFHDAQVTDRYLDELYDAEVYAYNKGLDNIATVLGETLAEHGIAI